MNNTYFYHPDHIGSTSLVTNSYGEITQNISYIPYGEIFVEETTGGWQSPYYFNAKELDEETGLYYYGARYLDPTRARWLSADPMLEKYMGMSPYNYCAGNPVRLVDPDGRADVYFEEDGSKIGEVKSETDNYYVTKTVKTTDELYEKSNPDTKGYTTPIKESDALRVKVIVNSVSHEDGVFKKSEIPAHLVVKIPTPKEAEDAFHFIMDDGTGGTKAENNKEYGWNFNSQKEIMEDSKVISPKAGDPTKDSYIPVSFKMNHTHPSGTKKGSSWQQAPSKQDIENTPEGWNRNVWGMGSRLLYINDDKGVKATVPFSIYNQ